MSMTHFSHGQKPTALTMNAIVTALNDAHTALGNYGASPGACKASSSTFFLVHSQRYLHFSSTGNLEDITGVFPDVNLSESDTGVGVLDLDSVGWLVYGQLYMVTGVSACLEHEEP